METNSWFAKVNKHLFFFSKLNFWTKIWISHQCDLDKIGRSCQTENDLKVYRNLTFEITSTSLREKLDKKGCFTPNCRQTTWVKNQYYSTHPNTEDGSIRLWLVMYSTAKVIQRKELLLATFSTFVADCGSYLGLFLGASVLSMTDTAFLSIKRALKKFRHH